MFVCQKCDKRFASGKTHKSRTKHPMRTITPEERAEEIRLQHLRKRLQLLRRRRPPELPGTAGDYVLHFGQYKGHTLDWVWSNKRLLILRYVNLGLVYKQVALQHAMREAGILQEAQKLAGNMNKNLSSAFSNASLHHFQDVHPESDHLLPSSTCSDQAIGARIVNLQRPSNRRHVLVRCGRLPNRQCRRRGSPRGRALIPPAALTSDPAVPSPSNAVEATLTAVIGFKLAPRF